MLVFFLCTRFTLTMLSHISYGLYITILQHSSLVVPLYTK